MINSIMLGTTNVMIRYVEVQQVLVTEIYHDKQYNVGHNKCYDQVQSTLDTSNFKGLGKICRVISSSR